MTDTKQALEAAHRRVARVFEYEADDALRMELDNPLGWAGWWERWDKWEEIKKEMASRPKTDDDDIVEAAE